MKIHLHIEADHVAEFKDAVENLLIVVREQARDAAAAAIAAPPAPEPESEPESEPKKRGRKPKAEEKPQISTGEERIGPDDVKDAEDEAAEVEQTRTIELTADDLKVVMARYVEQHGIPAAQEDGLKIFNDALGAPPAGESGWRLSLVASHGQDALRKAIAAWETAVDAGKRYGRD